MNQFDLERNQFQRNGLSHETVLSSGICIMRKLR